MNSALKGIKEITREVKSLYVLYTMVLTGQLLVARVDKVMDGDIDDLSCLP